MAAEVEHLAHDPLPAAELEPVQRAVEADLLERAQSVGGRAEALAIADIADGDWRGWEQRIARVHTLTPADVQRAAAKALVPTRRTLVWIAPSPESKGGSQ